MRSVLSTAGFTLGLHGTETALRLLYLVAITRLLGPEGYGVWAYILTAYGLALAVAAFGFEGVLGYAFGQSATHGRAILAAALFWRARLLILAGLGFIGFALVAWSAPASPAMILLALPALVARSCVLLVRSAAVATQHARPCLTSALFCRGGEVACGTAAMLAGADVSVILVVHGVSWIAEALLSARGLDLPDAAERPAPATSRALFAQGTPLFAMAALVAWLNAAPLLMLAASGADSVALAQLAVALQLATVLILGAQAVLQAAIPALTRLALAEDRRTQQFGWLVAGGALVVFGGFAAILEMTGERMVVALLGAEYRVAGQLSMAAGILACVHVLPNGHLQVMIARGQNWRGVLANLAACAAMTATLRALPAGSDVDTVMSLVILAWAVRAAVLLGFAIFAPAAGRAP